jgi:hypothetical protein
MNKNTKAHMFLLYIFKQAVIYNDVLRLPALPLFSSLFVSAVSAASRTSADRTTKKPTFYKDWLQR